MDDLQLTCHIVNGLHDLEHLVVSDLPVLVNVVQLESPCSVDREVSKGAIEPA